jgi:hypothetical protein
MPLSDAWDYTLSPDWGLDMRTRFLELYFTTLSQYLASMIGWRKDEDDE